MKSIELKVKGMHCASCVKIIEERLSELKGLKSVKVDLADEKLNAEFDDSIISEDKIKSEIKALGYSTDGSASHSLKEGLVYGLIPHIGCIGFIAASIIGATVAVEFFKPFLMNPWFFHILVLISIGFATISSAFYLKKNGLLSTKGVKRKKKYLATMYGATVGINLILFLAVFPVLANLDTGSFAEEPTVNSLSEQAIAGRGTELRLQVEIPCPGHAPLITGELKSITGVTGVKFEFPNYFDVRFNSDLTDKEEIFSLEVFETYPARLINETLPETKPEQTNTIAELDEKTIEPEKPEVSEVKSSSPLASNQITQAASCDGSCGGTGSCGRPTCGCSGR